MSNLIAAELFKLRTTRTFLGVCLGLLLPLALICILRASLDDFDDSSSTPGEALMTTATFVWIFAMIIGVIGVTSEFRHGTVTPTLLAEPDRGRVAIAKVIAHFVAGMLLGALAFLLAVVVAVTILPSRDIETGLETSDVIESVAGGMLGSGLLAAIGVGLGSLIGNQVVGIIVPVIYLLVLEALIAAIPGMDWLDSYGLNGTSAAMAQLPDAAFDDDDLPDVVPAGFILLGVTAAFVAAGVARLTRRDIESKT